MRLKKSSTAKILAKVGFKKTMQDDGIVDFDPKLYLLVNALCEAQEEIYSNILDGISKKLDAHVAKIKELKHNSLARHRRTLGPIKTINPSPPVITKSNKLLEHLSVVTPETKNEQ